MTFTVDWFHIGLQAIFIVATAASFWFFGGRKLATATIDQYKDLVEVQKKTIAEQATEIADLKRDNAYLLQRVDELERRQGLARTILSPPDDAG